MAFTRCQLATPSGGAAGATVYTFTYNPKIVDGQDDAGVQQIELIHGAPVFQKISFDGRPRVMRWESLSTSAANETMITAFKNRVGKPYYLNFNSLQTQMHYWPGLTTWNKCRIVDVKTKLKPGGRAVYEYIEVWFSPQQ